MLFERQTPEMPDGIEAEGFLDLLTDIEAYNREGAALPIECRVVTGVVVHKDKKRMPTRTAKLVLTPTSELLMAKPELERLVALFCDYVDEETDMRDVLAQLAKARSK